MLPAAGGAARPAPGPVRWAAPGGLRSLVEDLATGLDVTSEHEVEQVDATPGEGAGGVAVDGEPVAGVVLAMPQPQASDLLPVPLAARLGLEAGLDWSPTLTVWAGWDRPWWPELDGAFVDGSEVIDRIADDGRRRGDGAPVLVVHSTPPTRSGGSTTPRAASRACWPSSVACWAPSAPGMPPSPPSPARDAGRWPRPSPPTRARSRSTRTWR